MSNSLWSRPKQLALNSKPRICRISKKEDNLVGYTQIFERIFLDWVKCPFHFTSVSQEQVGLSWYQGKHISTAKLFSIKILKPREMIFVRRWYLLSHEHQQNDKNIQKYHAYFVHFHGRLPHNEFSGSYFNYCSAFQRENYLVRTKTGNSNIMRLISI